MARVAVERKRETSIEDLLALHTMEKIHEQSRTFLHSFAHNITQQSSDKKYEQRPVGANLF